MFELLKKSSLIFISVLWLVVFSDIAFAAPTKKNTQSNGFPVFWPPREGYYYPNLSLTNYDGKQISLSSLKGKVILFEAIGMSCPACQAFAGAGKNGISGLGGVVPQIGMSNVDELLSQQNISPHDPRLVVVQILLYNLSMQAPSVNDARLWAKHFHLEGKPNRYVLAGTSSLMGNASYNLIPGFQLVDKSYVLRCDSTGHNPKHNLYTELLPMLKKML